MKKQIRIGVFETNSSSTHSLVMMSKDKFEKFKNGEMFWYDGEILSKEQIIEKIKRYYPERENFDSLFKKVSNEDDDTSEDNNDEDDDILYELRTYDNYSRDYETFYSEYTTESGEVVVSLGYYGMDN